jgi:hypothetical protein
MSRLAVGRSHTNDRAVWCLVGATVYSPFACRNMLLCSSGWKRDLDFVYRLAQTVVATSPSKRALPTLVSTPSRKRARHKSSKLPDTKGRNTRSSSTAYISKSPKPPTRSSCSPSNQASRQRFISHPPSSPEIGPSHVLEPKKKKRQPSHANLPRSLTTTAKVKQQSLIPNRGIEPRPCRFWSSLQKK